MSSTSHLEASTKGGTYITEPRSRFNNVCSHQSRKNNDSSQVPYPPGAKQSGAVSPYPPGTKQSGAVSPHPPGVKQNGAVSPHPPGAKQSGTVSPHPPGTKQSGTVSCKTNKGQTPVITCPKTHLYSNKETQVTDPYVNDPVF